MLARRAGVMAEVSESLLMHAQEKLEVTYGGGFTPMNTEACWREDLGRAGEDPGSIEGSH